MNSKQLAICCAAIIVAAVVVGSIIVLTHAEETQIKILSNSSLYEGDNLTVQLTTVNGNPIANQSVNMTIVDWDGNITVYNVVTDSEGKATHEINKSAGNYTLECEFGGSNGYDDSNIEYSIVVKQKEVPKEVQASNSNSDPHPDWVCEGDTWYSKEIAPGYYEMYDKSTGRLIGNGDMPDRHGFHGDGYAEMYGHTVKYRKDGQYYYD